MPRKLQKLMVINKSRNLPLKLKLKTILIDIITWGLWIYVGYFIYVHADHILNLPIIDNLIFIDVIGLMFLILLGLLILTILWAVITRSKRNTQNKENNDLK
ncbi:HmsD [Bibersteinia trehalosi]|uniref:HmsD n=1 Tax=Bibersteinia trehalosi TaxID=47735 RepID=UPI004045D253